MSTCRSCRYFRVSGDGTYTTGLAPLGECCRWRVGYRSMEETPMNEVQVEGDEGWGAIMGPDFGCVLWESRH